MLSLSSSALSSVTAPGPVPSFTTTFSETSEFKFVHVDGIPVLRTTSITENQELLFWGVRPREKLPSLGLPFLM
jgi:hypothetical protein